MYPLNGYVYLTGVGKPEEEIEGLETLVCGV